MEEIVVTGKKRSKLWLPKKKNKQKIVVTGEKKEKIVITGEKKRRKLWLPEKKTGENCGYRRKKE